MFCDKVFVPKPVYAYCKKEGEGRKDCQKPQYGYEIMQVLSLEPGPIVGKIKKALEEAQLEGRVRTKEEAIEFIKSHKGVA